MADLKRFFAIRVEILAKIINHLGPMKNFQKWLSVQALLEGT